MYGGFALGVGWLLPLAILSGLALLWQRRRQPRTDLVRAAVLLWLTWLAGYTLVFSMLHHVNAYYTGVIVPAIGALVGTGAAWAWRASRERHTRWVVPAVLALCTSYSVLLLNVAGTNWSWLRAAVGALGAIAVLASALYLWPRAAGGEGSRTRAGRFVALLALAALVIAPAIGSLSLVGHQSGPYTFAFSQSGLGSFGEPAGESLAARYRRPVARLLHYIEPRTLGQRYLIATGGADEAAALIAATGRAVLPIGGYSGEMPIPNSSEMSRVIASHQLRFVSIEPRSNDVRLIWVLQTCRLIPGYETHSDISPRQARLYDCLGSVPLTGAGRETSRPRAGQPRARSPGKISIG
jgi:hypothetical protein